MPLLNMWQLHRKNFATTPGVTYPNCDHVEKMVSYMLCLMKVIAGRAAIAENPGRFNKKASQTLTAEQKQQLQREIESAD